MTSCANVLMSGVGRNAYSSAGIASAASARLRRIVAWVAFATLASEVDKESAYSASVVCAPADPVRHRHEHDGQPTDNTPHHVLLIGQFASRPVLAMQPA